MNQKVMRKIIKYNINVNPFGGMLNSLFIKPTKIEKDVREARYLEEKAREEKEQLRIKTEYTNEIRKIVNDQVSSVKLHLYTEKAFDIFLNVVNKNFLNQNLVLYFPKSNTWLTLNRLSMENFLDTRRLESTYDKYYGEIVEETIGGEFIITKIEQREGQKRKEGGLIPYLFNSKALDIEIDTEWYQLFTNFKPSNYVDNCLIYALRQYDSITEQQLNTAMSMIKNRYFPTSEISKVADAMGINIQLNYYGKDGKHQVVPKKFKNDTPIYRICLYDDHYFVYKDLGRIKVFGEDVRTSLSLIRTLMNNKEKCLIPMTDNQLDAISYGDILIKSLDYDVKQILRNNKRYFERKELPFNHKFNKRLIKKYRLKLESFYSDSVFKSSKKIIESVHYADFECHTYYEEVSYYCRENRVYKKKLIKKHAPYQIGFKESNCEINGVKKNKETEYVCYNYGKNMALSNDMLNDICKKYVKSNYIGRPKSDEVIMEKIDNYHIIYFHNAKYDSCFFDFNRMQNVEPIIKDGNFYGMSFMYLYKDNIYKFVIMDSLKFLNFALAKFPGNLSFEKRIGKEYDDIMESKLKEMKEKKCSKKQINKFKEDLEKERDEKINTFKMKEVIPYNLYTLDNVKKIEVPIKEGVEALKKGKYGCTPDDIKQFTDNIDKWDCKNDDGKFNIIEYSREYNKLDVEILAKGFDYWRNDILAMTGLDIFTIMTNASFAHQYFEREGAYEGVYRINQVARKFIQQTVYGGRCMLANNKKYYYVGRMQDFDAVSLYPSAIYRLKELGGILMGLPKILKENQLNMEFLKKCDGYFIDINISKMKKRDFPLIGVRCDGTMKYDTEYIKKKDLTVNRLQLEDLINFCNVEFEIKRGYYYDEGRNDKICDVILELFEKRLEYKKDKNALQAVIKEIMNSAYGKTIQKESLTTINIESHDGDDFTKSESFIYKYNKIKSVKRINNSNKFIVEEYVNIVDHYTMPQVGSEILSMSKRIMNEVMCLAEDNGIKIYYQDTDSMHIKEEDVDKLASLYKNMYKRELIGENMGQFHCDFSSDILKGNIYAVESIGLGKKSYIDVLTDGKGEFDYHFRMKGIPKESILEYCRLNNIDLLTLYKRMYNGEKFRFDLTCGGVKPKFKINTFAVETLPKFEREVKF